MKCVSLDIAQSLALSLVCGIFVIRLKNGGLAEKADSRASLQTIRGKERMRGICYKKTSSICKYDR